MTSGSLAAVAGRVVGLAPTAGSSHLRTMRLAISPRSLRVRLVLVVLAIQLVALVLADGVIIWKARTATQIEMASSMQLGEVLIEDTIRLLRDAPTSLLLQSIALPFQSIRHVRITVSDDEDRPIGASPASGYSATQTARATEAPAWFARMIAPPVAPREFPIVPHGRKIGTVSLRPEPADEIGDAWSYARPLFVASAILDLVMLAALFILFGLVLKPLVELGTGLRKIEHKDYAVRLPPASLLELSTLTDFFNAAAGALMASTAANARLNRALLTAQDDERRRTALELHDEVGPCMFTLEATAASVAALAHHAEDPILIERSSELVTLIGRVRTINRRMLDRLRPMTLGQIPLAESLTRLAVEYGTNVPAIETRFGELRASYGRLVDLTVYRCTQEGLFNAVRHASATAIVLAIDEVEQAARRMLSVRVVDDGRGLRHPLRQGLGLSGMRERVEALGGSFSVSGERRGTTLAITVPIDIALVEDGRRPAVDGSPSFPAEGAA